jgi:transcriptional regulator with XRE-family HTH domain
VIRWERGHHRPRADRLERIAVVAGVTVDWLLRGKGRRPRAAGRDPGLEAAIALLRAAWREPGRRARMLRALRSGPTRGR